MSRDRARRRAERVALAERQRAVRAATRVRRERRRSVLRRLRPRLPDRRTGRLFARRSRGERAGVAIAAVAVIAVVWLIVDSLRLRIGLTALVAVVAPALVVATLDRRT